MVGRACFPGQAGVEEPCSVPCCIPSPRRALLNEWGREEQEEAWVWVWGGQGGASLEKWYFH